MRIRFVCRLVVILLLQPLATRHSTLLLCQSTDAAVGGQITDEQGRVVPGVTVVLTNLNTGVTYEAKTNGDGFYNAPNLPPGIYRANVTKDGFKSIVKGDIELHVQDIASINFQLHIGSMTETVTVEAGGLVINTTDGSVSTVIDRNFVGQLPLNGRSFNTLLQLTPGVVIAPSSAGVSPGQFSINGQRTNANNFQVDGVSANFGISPGVGAGQSGGGGAQAFNIYGGTSSLVSVDAMQEFRIETSSFAPEYGHSPGGQVMILTRSGTSEFHGSGFDYFRNTVLDAADWFNNAAGLARTPEHQNDFGGVLGGPIIKDKTFFFFSYEGLRLLQPQTQLTTVPSSSARSSAIPGAAPYLNAFPLPNGPVSTSDPTVAEFTGGYDNRVTSDATSIRLDQIIKKWTLFGRYNYAPSSLINHGTMLSNLLHEHLDTSTVTVGVTAVLTPTWTNSFRANYSKQDGGQTASLSSFGGAVVPDLGLLVPSPLSVKTSEAVFSVLGLLGGSYSVGPGGTNQERQINILDDIALTRGAHQIKFGFDYRILNYKQSALPAALFEGANSIPGFASTAQIDRLFYKTSQPVDIRVSFFSFYGQDTWKLSPRLTLTYGLRWEFNPAPSPLNGTTLAGWNGTSDPSTTVLAPAGSQLWKDTYNNFAPRAGVAYQLTPKGDFILRGGWGIFYDLGTGIVPFLGGLFPNSGTAFKFTPTSVPIANVASYAPVLSSQPPYPARSSLYGFASDLGLPRSYQWNVALEKALAKDQSISLTYLGQVGRDLLRNVFEIQPNSNFGANSLFHLTLNGDMSNYNAMQVQYRRASSKNVQVLASYTWSHCIDTSSSDSFAVGTGASLPAQGDRGSCDFDVRQNLTAAVTYNLPHFTNRVVLSQLLNHWAIDGVLQARSGFPIDVTYGNQSIPGVPGGLAVRPDIVLGKAVWLASPTAPGGKILNAAAFDEVAPAAEMRQGTLGRNAITGFGVTQLDISVLRKFPFGEKVNLQLRGDLFNVLNHPNFSNPDSHLDDGSLFGLATQTLSHGLGGLTPLYQIGGPRSIQLSLKLNF